MNCPNCNGTVWCTEYIADCRQPAEVSVADDGRIVVHYSEPAVIIEEIGDSTLRCRGCDYTYEPYEFTEA